MKSRRGLWITAACITVIVGSLYGWYRWTWPHGPRTCFLPCLMSALVGDAWGQDGRYPDDLFSTNTITRLRLWGIRQPLAGLSGNITETVRRIEAGLPLDTNVSSWVYWPGARTDDPSELAIIWDREGGLAFNAHRANGNAVGFVDGSHRLISTERWPAFLKEQEELRARVLARRRPVPVPTEVKTQE